MTSPQNRPVRIGIQLPQEHADYPAIRRAAARAEELGADIIFNWDHFFPLNGDLGGKHFESWTMLGAWAESTSRVEIGSLVTCNSYRNPELLADMARTVDHISGGRLVLGIGSGWNAKDYSEYGYEYGTPGTRLAALAEALPRVERRFERLNPPPTRKIPVLIGGGGEQKTLRLVARHADIWHTFARDEVYARKTAILDGYCAEIGRDPAEIERSVAVHGAPEKAGQRVLEQGATLVILDASAPGYDLEPLRDWVAWRDERNA